MILKNVSIVIPTYNRPDFLIEAVQSVLAQTCPVFEILIVDDGSEEKHHDRIKRISGLGQNIFVYQWPANKGASAARNFGLEKAKGEYILFLDDDDLIDPGMIESSLKVFDQQPGIDVVTCLSRGFFEVAVAEIEQPGFAGKYRRIQKKSFPLNHPDFKLLDRITFPELMRYTLFIDTCLVKKACIQKIRFPEDLKAGEDTFFWLELAAQGGTFMLNKQYHAYVRYHAGNTQMRSGHDEANVRFFHRLLSARLAKTRNDLFLVHAMMSLRLLKMKRFEAAKHILWIMKSPDLVIKYFRSYYRKGSREMRSQYKRIMHLRNVYPHKSDAVDGPRLLFISPVVPQPSGNGLSMRAYHVLRALTYKYSVHLLIIPNYRGTPPHKELTQICRSVTYLPLTFSEELTTAIGLFVSKAIRKIWKRYSAKPVETLFKRQRRKKIAVRLFKGFHFDRIHVFRLYMAPYAHLFRDWNFYGSAQLDMDDIESLTRRRLSRLFAVNGDDDNAAIFEAEAKCYEEMERHEIPRFDRVFVCSAHDRDMLYHSGYKEIEVLQNIISIPQGADPSSPEKPFVFLFVGSMGYYPNRDAILYFCDRILPLIQRETTIALSVSIVGRGLSGKDTAKLDRIKEVRLAGYVPDIGTVYREAGCAILPIRAGGGTRLKALEAFAFRKPVVSTSLGMEGIEVKHEKEVLIADTPELFAKNCVRIMTDAKLRRSLAQNAFAFVNRFHTMETLGKIL